MGEEKGEEDQVGPDDDDQGEHGRGGGSSNHGQPQQADDDISESAGQIARVASGGSTSSASGRKIVRAAAPLDHSSAMQQMDHPQRTRRPSIDQMQNITAGIHLGIARALSGDGSGPRRSRRPSVDGSGGVGLIAKLGSDSGSRHSMIARALSGDGSGPRRTRRPSVDGSGGVGLIAKLGSDSGSRHSMIARALSGDGSGPRRSRRPSVDGGGGLSLIAHSRHGRDTSDDETFSVGSEDVFSRTSSGESGGTAERGVGGVKQSRRKSPSFDAKMSGRRRSRRPSFAEMLDEERSGPRRSRRPSLFDQPVPTLPPPPSQQEMELQVHEAIVRSQMEACGDPAQKHAIWEEYQQSRRARLGGGEQLGGSYEDRLAGEAASDDPALGASPNDAGSPTMMPQVLGGTPTAGPLGAEDGFAARLEKVRFREICMHAQSRARALVETVLPQ